MKTQTYHIEFLTPCFCAGYNQRQAELRATAIRGQLRWWYRALGGSAQEEYKVFGGVQGDQPIASSICIRIRERPQGGDSNWFSKIRSQGTDPTTYLLGFFCGRTGRLVADGALKPGSQATVEVLFRRMPDKRLEDALRVFFSMGAIGFRSTRTAGAITSREMALDQSKWNSLVSLLRSAGFDVALSKESFDTWDRLVAYAGNVLKKNLRGRKDGLGISAGKNGSKLNPLGSAEPRQASVLHLRPVRIDGKLRLALIEAPHKRILGSNAVKLWKSQHSLIAELSAKRPI